MTKYIVLISIIFGTFIGLWSFLPQAVLAQSVCQNDCSFFGQHESAGVSGRTCGNCDSDSCLEWSAWNACDIQSFFCGDKSCDSQCGENFSNCSKDCSIPNPVPVVDAGPNKEIFEGATVVLEGKASDSENELLTPKWDCNGGRLSDANILKPTYFSPSDIAGSEKVFSCNLRVEDFRHAISSDTVFVTVKKRVVSLAIEGVARNITQKQKSWQKNISAVPSDRIEFKIEVNATSDTANIFLKDLFPQGLSYQGNLKVGGKVSNQNIASSLNIGNLVKDQSAVITFEAKLLPENNFSIGTTALTNIIQARANFMPETSDKVAINVIKARASLAAVIEDATTPSGGTSPEALVKGATLVSTGVTNRIFESLLPPLLMALLVILAFKSRIIWLNGWLDRRKASIRNYETESSLKRKISQIKGNEKEIYETWKR